MNWLYIFKSPITVGLEKLKNAGIFIACIKRSVGKTEKLETKRVSVFHPQGRGYHFGWGLGGPRLVNIGGIWRPVKTNCLEWFAHLQICSFETELRLLFLMSPKRTTCKIGRRKSKQ